MKYIKSKFRHRAVFSDKGGQSLMEVVVALGVVLFVLISIVALVLINSFGQKGSENRTIALNLAREGIEVFRNMRDTARLQKTDVAAGTYTRANHFYTLSFTDTGNVWSIVSCVSPCSWPAATEIKYDATKRIYNNAGNYTIFKRRLTIDSICSDTTKCSTGAAGICENAEADDCVVENTSNYAGYRITSDVQWLENNQTVSLSLVDFLYDWR